MTKTNHYKNLGRSRRGNVPSPPRWALEKRLTRLQLLLIGIMYCSFSCSSTQSDLIDIVNESNAASSDIDQIVRAAVGDIEKAGKRKKYLVEKLKPEARVGCEMHANASTKRVVDCESVYLVTDETNEKESCTYFVENVEIEGVKKYINVGSPICLEE